jgi:hypothetical protein
LNHQTVAHIGRIPEMLSETGHQIKVYADGLERPYMRRALPLDISRVPSGHTKTNIRKFSNNEGA